MRFSTVLYFRVLLLTSVVYPQWFQWGSGSSFLSHCQGAKTMRIHADLDPDPGKNLKSQKVEFYMKIFLKQIIYKKKHTYKGTRAFLKGRKPGLFVNFSTQYKTVFFLVVRLHFFSLTSTKSWEVISVEFEQLQNRYRLVIIVIRIQACFYLHPDPGKQNILNFSKTCSKGPIFLHIQKSSPVFINYAIVTKCKKVSTAQAAK